MFFIKNCYKFFFSRLLTSPLFPCIIKEKEIISEHDVIAERAKLGPQNPAELRRGDPSTFVAEEWFSEERYNFLHKMKTIASLVETEQYDSCPPDGDYNEVY